MLIPTRKTITTTLQKTPFPERESNTFKFAHSL